MALVIMPLGLSPLGLAVPPTSGAQPLPPVIAAEKIDPKTRDIASMVSGSDVIDAQVQLALTVLRGSGAAVVTTGQRFRDVTKLDDNAASLLESQARVALQTLVERGDITIDSIGVVIDSSNAFAEVTINYINQRAIGLNTRSQTVRTEASTR